MKYRQKKILIVVTAVLCLAAAAYFIFFADKGNYSTYSNFRSLLKEEKIASVSLSDDAIRFSCTDGTSFYTDNPQSPTLYEELLLSGIEVKKERNIEGIISLIFDLIFYGIFVGIFAVVFSKFISPNTFKAVNNTGVTFKDVVGMSGLKKDMMQIADIMKNPKKYADRGIRLPKGVLLEGAPGNGKTLFARALAGECGVPFIPAKATDFESMFMAIGPLKVKLLFKKARRRAPCIVFIDEFDGIGTKRNYSGSAIETENTRIVTAMLNELDGFTPNSGILVLAATNSLQALDPALVRPGRFDAKYTVPYPGKQDRIDLCRFYMEGKNAVPDCTPEILAPLFEGRSAAFLESVLNRASLIARQNDRDAFDVADVKAAIKENRE